ncbi:MAG: ferritin-like domain-containing protein, partial [Sorangiineae bacterium PRO1]|nr:ferritin-like domain-containing protein [Sorangiineae bacterium PRO1]
MSEEQLDLGDLGLDEGAHLLLARRLGALSPGAELRVTGTAPTLAIDLGAWCRSEGHELRA